MYVVFFLLSSNFMFYLINALVYVNIDQGIHKVKFKVSRNEKNQKTTWVFIYIKFGNY